MTGRYAKRTPDRSAKAVTAVTLLALLLVTAVPVALLAAVVMMMLGHVVGGLALFGGSILAAAIAVTLAGMTGMRHLRKLLSRGSLRVVQLDGSQYTDLAEPQDSESTNVVRLDHSEYTEVRLPNPPRYCVSFGPDIRPVKVLMPLTRRRRAVRLLVGISLIDDEVAERFLASQPDPHLPCGARECVQPGDSGRPARPARGRGGSL
jgi:hypothetical protein